MARGGSRIGELLKLTPNDIEDRKLTLRTPKSWKEREMVFIPQKTADRLKKYITTKVIGSGPANISDILHGRERSCEQSRKSGGNPFETPRSQETCSDLRLPIGSTN